MLFSLFIKVPTLYKISYRCTTIFSPTATLRNFFHFLVNLPGWLAKIACQNRQASTHRCVLRQGAGSSFVRTDKQAPTATFPAARARRLANRLSEQTSKHPALLARGRRALSEQTSKHGGSCCQAGPAGKLLSEQTSKQLSTGYPQSVVSYPQVTAE
tara:strand:+ start:542 stop:1012 length:471 start_codon:yes stop_codon:yes gene_type:complete